MSIILGLKTPECIILAGDKRGTNIKNGKYLDDTEKVIVINDSLAFAWAGVATYALDISYTLRDITIDDKKAMTTNDLAEIIKNSYSNIREGVAKLIGSHVFACIIAGKNNNGEMCLIACNNYEGDDINFLEVPHFLFKPEDMDFNECAEIFAKNLKTCFSDFAEKTIREVSAQSKFVSPTGDKWMYRAVVNCGKLESF